MQNFLYLCALKVASLLTLDKMKTSFLLSSLNRSLANRFA